MKELFTFLALVTLTLSFGQYTPLLRPGTVWHERTHCVGTDPCHTYGPFNSGQALFVGQDSTINATTYKQIRAFSIYQSAQEIPQTPCFFYDENTSASIFVALLREDTISKKVYLYNETTMSDSIIYDFSLSVGDTLWRPDMGFFEVSNVSQITINGDVRDVFTGTNGVSYIEGLGSDQGLLAPLETPISGCAIFSCVRHNDINEYGECNQTLALEDLEEIEILVYPNPVDRYLIIDSGSANQVEFSLYALSGELMFSETLMDQVNSIDLEKLVSGIYFYQIDGIQKGKLVKR